VASGDSESEQALAKPGLEHERLALEVLQRTLNSSVKQLEDFVSAPLYRVSVSVDYELFTYSGSYELHFRNTERDALNELVFFVYPNTPGLNPSNTRRLSIQNLLVDGRQADLEMRGSLMKVSLAKPLKPGESARVNLDFRGVLPRLPDGSSRLDNLAWEQALELVLGGGEAGYGVLSVGEEIVSMALWCPILASYDNGAWDVSTAGSVGDVSYFDVANYEVELTVPASVAVVTTGVEVARTERNGMAVARYQAGAVREFTLQMSERYDRASRIVDGVKVSSWFRESESATGKQVLEYAEQALRTFNTEFGPYPYTELDVVEAPLVGGAGGVEFPGLVTVARMFYLPDQPEPTDLVSDALRRSSYFADTLEFVVAHEVAHEWWNAAVGSDSKQHPFVDEALANHSAIRYFEVIHGKKAAELQRDVQLRLPYHLARLLGSTDQPVDLPTSAFGNTLEYAATVYGKGALFFEHLRTHIGDIEYFGALRAYYKAFQFGVAAPDDLLDLLVQASSAPEQVRALAQRWLKERHGDADIAPVSIGRLATYLLDDELLPNELESILVTLEHPGLVELMSVGRRVLKGQDIDWETVRWKEISTLALSGLSKAEQRRYRPLAMGIAEVLGSAEFQKHGLSLKMLMRVVKHAFASEPEVRMLLDATERIMDFWEDL
jgi:hypothetical protein